MSEYRLTDLFIRPLAFSEVIEQAAGSAEEAREQGLVSLEDSLKDLDWPEPFARFFRFGVQLVIDGADAEVVRDIMASEHRALLERMTYRWEKWKGLLLYLTEHDPLGDDALDFVYAGLYAGHQDNGDLLTCLEEFLTVLFGKTPRKLGSLQLEDFPEDYMEHPLVYSNLQLFVLREKLLKSRLEATLNDQYVFYEQDIQRCFRMLLEACLLIHQGASGEVTRDILSAMCGHEPVTE